MKGLIIQQSNDRRPYRTPRSILSAVTLMSGTRDAVVDDIFRLYSSLVGRRRPHDHTDSGHPFAAAKYFYCSRLRLRRIELLGYRFVCLIRGFSRCQSATRPCVCLVECLTTSTDVATLNVCVETCAHNV